MPEQQGRGCVQPVDRNNALAVRQLCEPELINTSVTRLIDRMAMVTRGYEIPLEDGETFNGFQQQRSYI